VIETIYSNESGESGKMNKVQPAFKMPKNIRQIGKGNTGKDIYVEDYVMTFVKQLAGGDYSGCKLAVLVGQSIRLDNVRNIFVSGALEVKGLSTEEIVFSNEVWTGIYEDIKEYFAEAEIVGWFIGGPGYLLEDEEKILKIHLDNFAGQDKVLLTFENMEREETFYCYESGKLTKQEGYYIYYEKNEEMQNYMVNYRDTPSSEADYDDKISRDIRAVLQNKKLPLEEGQNTTRLMYAAGTLLAAIILVVGAAILNNYDQMKSMQETMKYLTTSMEQMQQAFSGEADPSDAEDSSGVKNAEVDGTGSKTAEEATKEGSSGEQSLEVEVISGGVKTKGETEEAGDKTADKASDETADKASDKTVDKASDKTVDKTSDQTPAVADKTAKEAAGSDKNSSKKAGDTNTATPTPKEQKKSSTGTSTAKSSGTQKQVNYYVVKKGDTLADISHKLYGTYTKTKTIMQLNNLENADLIYEGQKLIVP